MRNRFYLVLLLSLVSFAAFSDTYFGDGFPTSGNNTLDHINLKRDFIQKNLKNGIYYDLLKIRLFTKRIEEERDFFLSNLYETTLMEEIELQISKPSHALEEAREELNVKKSDFAVAFDQYLIPRLRKLTTEFQHDSDCLSICDGIVDEFLEVYSGFYTPSKYRNYFNMDNNWSQFYKHKQGYRVELNAARVEATNLLVSSMELGAVRNCLGGTVETNQYLNQAQITMLKQCDFDISLLDPGKSIYWQKPSVDRFSVFKKYSALFPTESDEVYFKKVKFSGKGSPKIKAQFTRGGVDYKVKLKIGGYEAHSENFIGRVARLIGFHQDVSQYRRTQIVIFKDKDDWNEFQSFIYRKYGYGAKNNLFKIEGWGKDGKKVTFRHVSIEITPKKLHKLSTADPFGWDRKNLREFRGALLWFGFFNLADIKNENWRVQLRETINGLQPEMTLQDAGYALGSGNTFHNIVGATKILGYARNVNLFQDSYLKRSKKSILVKWNDPMSYHSLFVETTYADLKWMARKILKVGVTDIKYFLKESGFSEAEQVLYLKKISARRDEMIKIFELTNEFEYGNLGSFKEVNIPGVVKNGEVIVSSTDSIYEYVDSNILLNIGTFIQRNIDIGGFDASLQASIGSRLGVIVNPSLPFSLIEDKDFTLYLARPGIELGFTREVKSGQFVRYENGSDQKYFAIDRYTFGLTSKSGIQAALSKYFPVEIRAKISHFKFSFDHYRPFTTAAQALNAPASLLHVLPRLQEYTRHMKRDESITYSNETEFSFKVRVGAGQNYRVGLKHERMTSQPITIHRNHFGEMQVFQEKIRTRGNYVQLSAGVDTPLFYIPLLSIDHAFIKYSASSKMYHFPLQEVSLDNAISQYYSTVDQSLLNELLNGNTENPLLKTKIKIDLSTESHLNRRTLNLAFLFTGRKDEIYSSTKLNFMGSEKSFQRYYYANSDTLGLDNTLSAHLLWSKDKTTLEIQMDEDDPEDFVVLLNNYDFKKNLTKFGLEKYIGKQNSVYSFSDTNKFFNMEMLPPSSEVNSYKKVMSHVRVFLYGKGLLKKLDKLWDSELRNLISNHLGIRLDPVDFAKSRGVFNDLRSARTLHKRGKISNRIFLRSVGRAIFNLRTSDKGLDILKVLFGEKNIFVMGEIHGVLPSFSYSQNFNNEATRRFTGKSWGNYKKRPPFWKFLKDFPIQVRTGLIPYRITEDLLFSELPESMAQIN